MFNLLLSSLLLYKYTILCIVIFSASVGFPIPATALLMAAGAFAAQGYFDLPSILFVSFVASVSGDILGYTLSFRYGREILMRIGFKTLLLSEKFRALETLFSEHSAWAIFSSRFLATSLWPTVNILAGLSKTPYKKFVLYDILWESLYVLLFAGLGYIFSDQWETISRISGDISAIIVLGIVLLVFSVLLWRAKVKTSRVQKIPKN